jgi:hypothetical protein
MANIVIAQNSSELKTIDDVGGFMKAYYLHPQPNRIGDVIDALDPTGFLKRPTTANVVIGFFSEIFAANPNRLPEWQSHIAKQDDQTRRTLEQALAVSKSGGVLNNSRHSAGLNDACWAAFFATGNPKFVDKIIDELRYFDERNDEGLFFSGATAKWSLASNARDQPAVRSAIENAKVTADKRTRELITELLSEDPVRIKQEIEEVVKTQRDAGQWK